MTKVYQWQKVAFKLQILASLKHIEGYSLNYLEFRLLVDQARLIFPNKEEAFKCQSLFIEREQISKEQFVSRLNLIQTVSKHCKKYHIVKLAPSLDQVLHAKHRCFEYWIKCMRKRYGHFHIWFELLCQERDIRRVPVRRFINHINDFLKDSPHPHCSHRISSFFQKSKASQIESAVFMNTVLIHRKLIRDDFFETKDTKNLTASTNFLSRDSKVGSDSQKRNKTMRSTGIFSKQSSGISQSRYRSSVGYDKQKMRTEYNTE